MSELDGDIFFEKEKYKKARKKYRRVLGKKTSTPVVRARLHRKIGNCYRREAKFERGLEEYNWGLSYIANIRPTKIINLERACLHLEKGICHFYMNPMDSAKYFTEKSQELLKPYELEPNPDIQASLGDVYHFLAILDREQGRTDQFTKNIEKAKRHFDLASNKKKSLECEFNWNVERLFSGNYEEPIAFFKESIKKIRKLIPNRVSFAHLNLAIAYAEKGDFDLAETNAHQSIKAAVKVNDPIGQQRAYELLASISRDKASLAINSGDVVGAQKHAGDVKVFINTGIGISQNLQGSDFQEFEYIGLLINAEVNVILGNLNEVDNNLNDAIHFSDVNNLKLSLYSRAKALKIRAMLYTAYGNHSTVEEEQRRYWHLAIKELERARKILEKDRLNGKLIRVDIKIAELEILLNKVDAALKTLNLALDKAQQFKREVDIVAILRIIQPLLDKKQESVGEIDDIKVNQLIIKYAEPSSGTTSLIASYRIELFDVMRISFNCNELRDLCFFLSINYEDLPQMHSNMVRELILMMIRMSRLCELYCLMRIKRRNAPWPILPDCDCTVYSFE